MTWNGINVKTAAALAGVSPRTFREEWVPEHGPAKVEWRPLNDRTGRFRRIEVNLEDLEEVLEIRKRKRTG